MDIVERLRLMGADSVGHEAATEITQLREQVEVMMVALELISDPRKASSIAGNPSKWPSRIATQALAKIKEVGSE